MPTAIALLRGINVGGRHMLPMESLRCLCEGIGLQDPQTYIQSGNVVFRASPRDLKAAAARLEKAIEAERGFRPQVIIRTLEELRALVAANPLAAEFEPAKTLVMFLAAAPAAAGCKAAAQIIRGPETLHVRGREVFLYFPDGVGKSKLSTASIESALKVAGTCRNWNTTLKLLAMAEALEST